MSENTRERWVTTKEAGREAGVTPRTIRYWIEAGLAQSRTEARTGTAPQYQRRRPRLYVWLPDVDVQAGMLREKKFPQNFWPDYGTPAMETDTVEFPRLDKDREPEEDLTVDGDVAEQNSTEEPEPEEPQDVFQVLVQESLQETCTRLWLENQYLRNENKDLLTTIMGLRAKQEQCKYRIDKLVSVLNTMRKEV